LQSKTNLFVTLGAVQRPARSKSTMFRNLLPLATRVLTGEASGAERKQLSELLKQPEPRAWFGQLQKRWQAAAAKPVGGFDAQDAARRLAVLIHSTPTTGRDGNETGKTKKMGQRLRSTD